MTKLRKPGTYESGLTLICGRLGVDGAARVVKRSLPLIYKWTDPDSESLPNLPQCELLDKASISAGGRPALFEIYKKRIEAFERHHNEMTSLQQSFPFLERSCSASNNLTMRAS